MCTQRAGRSAPKARFATTSPESSRTPALRAGAASALAVMLVLAAGQSHASSVAMTTVSFAKAVTTSARVVKGKVTARREVKVDGATLHAIDVAIEGVLKGAPAPAGAVISVFDPMEWFRHTHAAALRGGVVSYVDARYATPLPDADIKPGAALIVFLNGDKPPAGFPADAAFLFCTGGFERATRAKDVTRTKAAELDKPIRLKMGETAVLPDGLEIEVKAHSHKRPMVGGPSKEMAEVAVRNGASSEMLTLGHEVDPDGTQSWEKKRWRRSHEIELVGMKYDDDTTLRVRQLVATPRAP